MSDFENFLRSVADARPQPVQTGVDVVVRELLARCEFVKTVDELVAWDPAQCQLSPGQRLLTLVAAFVEDRRALFRMPQVFATKDVEVLLGSGVSAEWLNDKALGRARDKLYVAGAGRVYGAVCLRAVEAFHVVAERLHMDTTSVSAEGAYEGEVPVDVLGITYGYSKDRRPDLKQFKMGAVVTPDGIPLVGDVFDGNGTDQTWNKELLRWLSSWLGKKETPLWRTPPSSPRRTSAGSPSTATGSSHACPTRSGRRQSPDPTPSTGPRTGGSTSAPFQTPRMPPTTVSLSAGTRLARRRTGSSSSTPRSSRRRRRRPSKKAVRSLSRETFSCREDAESAFASFLEAESPQFFSVTADVWEDTSSPRRLGPGRPRADEPPPAPRRAYSLDIHIGELVVDHLESERRWESTFVLISNDEPLSARELFEAYRGQAAVEAAFCWLKAPVRVSPVFLKKPERVEAFSYVMLMAYLVAALIQKLVRDALPKLEIEGRRTDRPTAQAVIDVIAHAQVLVFRPPGERPKRLYITTDARINRIMELLRIPADAFLTVPTLNSG